VAASLHCGGLGSATHLTASFGFAAVGRVLDTLAERANSVDPAAAVRPA
jgi:tRNA A37 threonylcarbamoyladenosine dehydratase